MSRLFRYLLTTSLMLPTAGWALGPHELLLLVNADSPRSVEVANHYIRLRNLPAINVVALHPPPAARSPQSVISRDEFTRTIWEPAQQAIKDRRIGDHILAWVYSADFPVLIAGEPEVALTGLTFVRNQLPEAELIRKGAYASPVFAGPGTDLKRRGTPGSLEQYAMQLGTRMPLPGMMLAHTGARGESVAQAVQRLKKGLSVQASRLPGQVVFLTSDDIRTTCRSWQFADAVAELKTLGQSAQIMPLDQATPSTTAWGLMAGASIVDPARLPRLIPGSLAEHLTSFAGVFYGHAYQSKMTAWLQAGAAGTAGTVTEPMSIWTKFPHARLFVYYASGCTWLESYAQSVACPLQSLPLGDPLLAPWARPPGATLVSLQDETTGLTGMLEFAASSWAGPQPGGGTYYTVDGRTVVPSGNPPLLRIAAEQLEDGWHEARAVIYGAGAVRHQAFTTLGFRTAHRGRSLTLQGLASNETLRSGEIRELQVQAVPAPQQLALARWGELLDPQTVTDPTRLVYRLDTTRLGAGPVEVQLAALYEDGVVRSDPVPVTIERPDPRQEALAPRNGLVWHDLRLDPKILDGSSYSRAEGGIELQAESGLALARSELNPEHVQELVASLALADGEQTLAGQSMALAFAVQDRENFQALRWIGDTGGWSIGRMVKGSWVPARDVGATLEAGQVQILRIQRDPAGGVRFMVNGEELGRSREFELKGPYGAVAGTSKVTLHNLGVWTDGPAHGR